VKLQSILLTTVLAASAGCSFHARGADDYRKAVRKVLDTRNEQVESCYRQELHGKHEAAGKVVVRFDVAPKTGEFTHAKVVEKQTTAAEPLQKCVLGSLDGLKLAPPDQRKGEATFTWQFGR
jgi:outer membrane lipopolysaccharide assembly protein LptE/RlpB